MDLSKLSNIKHYFGDVIKTMKNDILRVLLEKNQKESLKKFDDLLYILSQNTNVKDLIAEYKTHYLVDSHRFDSLLSELRAGYFLLGKGLPVKFLIPPSKSVKTPDIETKLNHIKTYVEVKRVTERIFEEEKIIEELRKSGLGYFIYINVNKPVYNENDVINEIKKIIGRKKYLLFP